MVSKLISLFLGLFSKPKSLPPAPLPKNSPPPPAPLPAPSVTMIDIATKEIGTSEILGPAEHNPRILHYSAFIGEDWIKDDETSWCGIFVGFCAKTCGKKLPVGPASARSWLTVGKNVDKAPLPGDVVILWRETIDSWKGHVGLFAKYSEDKTRVFMLGGNQGDKVCIADYDATRILGIRRLEDK